MGFTSFLPVPVWCYHCNANISLEVHHFLCTDCVKNLPYWSESKCCFCGEKQPGCGCKNHFGLNGLKAIFNYYHPIDFWVASLKYHRNFLIGRLIRDLIDQWIDAHTEWITGFDLIEPIPIHWTTQASRGFNHASFLGRNFHVSIHKGLRKVKGSKHQAGLNLLQRRKNTGHREYDYKGNLEGKRVLLFDDVCSTGSTLKTIADLLHDRGATSVDALVLARNIR